MYVKQPVVSYAAVADLCHGVLQLVVAQLGCSCSRKLPHLKAHNSFHELKQPNHQLQHVHIMILSVTQVSNSAQMREPAFDFSTPALTIFTRSTQHVSLLGYC